MRKLLCMLVLVGIASPTFADLVRLSGRIVNSDGAPIADVQVALNGYPELVTVTNSEGKWMLTNAEPSAILSPTRAAPNGQWVKNKEYYTMQGRRLPVGQRVAQGIYVRSFGSEGLAPTLRVLAKDGSGADSLVIHFGGMEAGRVAVPSLSAGVLPTLTLCHVVPLAEPMLALRSEPQDFYGLIGHSVPVTFDFDETLWRPIWLSVVSDTVRDLSGSSYIVPLAEKALSLPVVLGLASRVQELQIAPMEKKIYGDTEVALSAVASSGLPVSWSSTTPEVCLVVEDKTLYKAQIVGAGVCGLQANQSGNANWNGIAKNVDFTVEPRVISVLDLTAENKTYDGTLSAILQPGTLSGVLNGDDVTLVAGKGVFEDKHAGIDKTVILSGFSLSGADQGKYKLEVPSSLRATIATRELVWNGVVAEDKVYDGNDRAVLSGGTLVGIVDGDVVELLSEEGVFATKAVGNSWTVTLKDAVLTGANAADYAMLEPQGLTANIAPKTLTASVKSRSYDGTTNAELELVGLVSGDEVRGSGVFANKNVGTEIAVSNWELEGADAGNYRLEAVANLSGGIDAKVLTLDGLLAVDKEYDGSAAATLATPILRGVVGSEDVGFVMGHAEFDGKAAGANRQVNVAGFALSGLDCGNYSLDVPTTLLATIRQKSLTLDGLVASDKVYDGTTDAELTVAALTGVLAGDDVALVTGNGHFTDANAGFNRAVILADYALLGTDAANYKLSEPVGLAASIAPKALTVSAKSKVYDGTTSVDLEISGNIEGDTVQAIAQFVSRNVGADVEIEGLALQGADAGNYSLDGVEALHATISAKTLTALALDKTYDGTQDATLSLTGVVSGDDVVGKGTFARKKIGTNIGVTNLTLSGEDAGNYQLGGGSLSAAITARPLTVAVQTKEYDGTTAATLLLTGTVVGDDVSGRAEFTSKAVGSGKAVANLILEGDDADNYSLAGTASLTGNITLRTLTAAVNSKVYDGTTTATLQLTGLLAGDDVTGTGAFAKADVGTGIVVSSVLLAGADKANYQLGNGSGLTGAITARPVTVTAVTGSQLSKVYDGTTDVPIDLYILEGTHYQLNNVIVLDNLKNVDINITAYAFNSANVPEANKITLQYSGLKGSKRANYSIAAGSVDIPAHIEQATPVITLGVPPKLSPSSRSSSLSPLVTIAPLTGGVVTYTSEIPDICSVASTSGEVTALVGADAAGNYPAKVCRIRVAQAATDNYVGVYSDMLVPFKGTVKDTRDGQIYATVQIGTQTWMAQNLNYTPVRGNSWCYNNDVANCATYGRLYDWATAMNVEVAYNNSFLNDSINNPGICPEGWHVPRASEWDTLNQYADLASDGLKNSSVASSFWVTTWNGGTDVFGFSILPSLYRSEGLFQNSWGSSFWWTATEMGALGAYSQFMDSWGWRIPLNNSSKINGNAIRCIQDE